MFHIIVCALEYADNLQPWILPSLVDDQIGKQLEIAVICMCSLQLIAVVRVFYDQIINLVKNTTTYERKGYKKLHNRYKDSDTSSMLLLEDSVAWGRASKNMQSDLVQAVEIIQVESGCLCFRKPSRVLEEKISISEERKE